MTDSGLNDGTGSPHSPNLPPLPSMMSSSIIHPPSPSPIMENRTDRTTDPQLFKNDPADRQWRQLPNPINRTIHLSSNPFLLPPHARIRLSFPRNRPAENPGDNESLTLSFCIFLSFSFLFSSLHTLLSFNQTLPCIHAMTLSILWRDSLCSDHFL